MKHLISHFLTHISQEIYEKEINLLKEYPGEGLIIIIYNILAIAIPIALIYLYILIVKYLRLKIKEMKKVHD